MCYIWYFVSDSHTAIIAWNTDTLLEPVQDIIHLFLLLTFGICFEFCLKDREKAANIGKVWHIEGCK